ncbi:hypothetical protein BC936DRAFT_140056 [Jimgerdemannia flammicorona]|uniref:HTH TFE/IIEalpha-type domain-containing protein n=1 Tax=Jimgerdemannia flammicorona TaxID=994334 RepID=A0A433DH64_9FUNG|nr:hypothetical protein BC936DRAFT_140056 [Jimgerdemannia flammicorona]
MDVLKILVGRVARSFYAPQDIVVLDTLNKVEPNDPCVTDEKLSQFLNVPLREVHKICGRLMQDRLIKSISRSERRQSDLRAFPKTYYYYIDYKQFVDVVKWKLYIMQEKVKQSLRTDSEANGFICGTCKRTYGPLEVLSFDGGPAGEFCCEVCEGVPLQMIEFAQNVEDLKDRLARLQEQTRPIVELLKKTDTMVIFAPRAPGSAVDPTVEKPADDSTGYGQVTPSISVDLQTDDEAARRAKQEEADRKRVQNVLPIWYQKSTISRSEEVEGDVVKEDEVRANEKQGVTDEGDAIDIESLEKYYANYQPESDGYEMLDVTEEGLDKFNSDDEVNWDAKQVFEYRDEMRKRPKIDVEANEQETGDGKNDNLLVDDDMPLVSVGGVMVPLQMINEAHEDQMSKKDISFFSAFGWSMNLCHAHSSQFRPYRAFPIRFSFNR